MTLEELNNELHREPKPRVTVSFNDGINTKTRCGAYLTVSRGMVSDVYFVGKDLENNEDIVEFVG